MEARRIDYNKDLGVISLWWVLHEWPPIQKDLLPETGFIVDDHAAGFLYMTDSKFCVLEWIIGNPESDKEKRGKAVDLVLEALLKEADDSGCKAIFTSTEHKSLIERYKRHGFNVTDKNMTNLVRLR